MAARIGTDLTGRDVRSLGSVDIVSGILFEAQRPRLSEFRRDRGCPSLWNHKIILARCCSNQAVTLIENSIPSKLEIGFGPDV